MKKYIIAIFSSIASIGIAPAQNSMDKVLQSVLEHNKELKAGSSQTEAQKLQARTENNLPDPEVSYVHQWGNKEGMGFSGEFVASQSFDFPTLYSQRSKRIKAESRSLDSQFALLRQQVLLQAKQVCLDLIYLNQLRSLQKDRLHNADILSRFYASQLEKGATNVIETNKVDLELLNARNEARQNEVAIKGKLEELKALNGGIEIAFADSIYLPDNEYPEDFNAFCMQALESLPEIQSLRENQAVAARQLTVSKQQWLPNLTLGYRMNPASGGERYDGVLVGISIPIFANRNKVKQAKAEHFYAETRLDSQSDAEKAQLKQLWMKAGELRKSIQEYSSVLKQQDNMALLNKAIQAGQISMIEYFVNVSTFYQSMQNYLQLQNEYQKVMAELYRFLL